MPFSKESLLAASVVLATVAGVGVFFLDLRSTITEDSALLREDFSGLRAEVRGDIDELRGEFSGLRTEVRGDIAGLRGEFGDLREDFSDLRGEFGNLREDLFERLHKAQSDIDALDKSMSTLSSEVRTLKQQVARLEGVRLR